MIRPVPRLGRVGRFLGPGVLVALVAPLVVLLGVPGTPAGAEPGGTPLGSTVRTVTADPDGPFAGLEVTVDRTEALVNQSVRVSWSGAAPSKVAASGLFLTNFLQVMQCWAEPGEQPDREQCQYGGFGRLESAGFNVPSRIVSQFQRDPLEVEYGRPEGDFSSVRTVDFRSVDGTVTTGEQSQYFDSASTNEVPLARTRPDGRGDLFFEVQTGLEAPGLGCGQVIDGRTPDCFLVVVPRNDREVNGDVAGTTLANPLISSPLSQGNWNNRLVVPLGFVPIGASCVLGRPETPTTGTDLVTEAVTRWQPKLCEGGARNFGFTSLPDGQTRDLLASPDPGLVFLNSAPGAPAGTVVAPVALSGLSIVANIEQPLPTNDPDGRPVPESRVPAEIRANVSRRFESIKLSPRLIAKLLTQSYRFDVAGGTASNVADNPFDLSRDPEFLALNPGFQPQGYPLRFPNSIGRLLMPAGLLDSADLVWRYLLTDKEARDFLAGKADPWGMVLNEKYQGLVLPTSSYPRSDLGCEVPGNVPPGFDLELCTLDSFPYASSLAGAARQVSRGETGRRESARLDPTKSYGATPIQTNGRRSMIAISDTPSAKRYQVVDVALKNAAGQYVVPDEAGLTAAVGVMTKDENGMLRPNLASTTRSAYPLTLVTYAATVPARLSADARSDYARLIRYAVGEGQTLGLAVGGLAEGYVPLPPTLRTEALAAAAALESYTPPTPTPTPSPTVTPSPTATPVPSSAPTIPDGTQVQPAPPAPAPVAPAPPSPPSPQPSPSATAPPTVTPSTTPVAAVLPTPADPTSAARYAVVAVLVLGGAALLARAALPWIGARPPG